MNKFMEAVKNNKGLVKKAVITLGSLAGLALVTVILKSGIAPTDEDQEVEFYTVDSSESTAE